MRGLQRPPISPDPETSGQSLADTGTLGPSPSDETGPSGRLSRVSSAPRPVDESVLVDLKDRLRAFRRVPLVEGVGWSRGTDADYLDELIAYWINTFYWREHEERILDHPRVHTGSGETGLRAIHQTAGVDAPTVVLLHGWPDSVLRFERVLPLLTDVNVVVPALPGFPYAEPVTRPGLSTTTMADLVAASLAELGIDRYVVSGGDIGSSVAEAMGRRHAEHVAAFHLTDIPYWHLFSVDPSELDEAERTYVADGQRWRLAEGAYAMMQATKPHTLAAALGDSPAGLAAWIVEKLRSWSDWRRRRGVGVPA